MTENRQKAIPFDNSEKKLNQKMLYQSMLKKKDFSLTSNGLCDDALEDTLHQRFTAYIDSKETNDSNVVIEFKFKDACCQEFLGDYTVLNDTLVFSALVSVFTDVFIFTPSPSCPHLRFYIYQSFDTKGK